MKKTNYLISFIILSFLLFGCAKDTKSVCAPTKEVSPTVTPEYMEVTYNSYDTLNVATYITRIDGVYFINDCYHDQILYNDSLDPNLRNWKVLTSDVHYSHTVAGDGHFLICDDTENDRVLVFEQNGMNFRQLQILDGIGMKPHFTYYDSKRDVFMAWSSITGEMYYFEKNSENLLAIKEIKQIQELYGVYVRSFSIIDDHLVFVSGHNNQKILIADADTFEVIANYSVPDSLAGMVQITKCEDYYYITISTDNHEDQSYATIVRTPSLDALSCGDYEDIYTMFGTDKGTPYNITTIDGRFYLSHHGTAQNIIAFDIQDNHIENVEILY